MNSSKIEKQLKGALKKNLTRKGKIFLKNHSKKAGMLFNPKIYKDERENEMLEKEDYSAFSIKDDEHEPVVTVEVGVDNSTDPYIQFDQMDFSESDVQHTGNKTKAEMRLELQSEHGIGMSNPEDEQIDTLENEGLLTNDMKSGNTTASHGKFKVSKYKNKLIEDDNIEHENKVFRKLVSEIDDSIKVESYWVETVDNYFLKVFRLYKPGQPQGPPVLMQHGLFQNAEKFLWIGKKSIAYQFVESGFDVWLGNNRGSIYSRKNEYLDPVQNEDQFFDYSFFEMGKYDLPAMINGIINHLPDYTDLTYVGYSQGTTQMFSALALNHNQLQDKVNFFIALAPIVRLDHSTNIFIQVLKRFPESLSATLFKMHHNFLFGPKWGYAKATICELLPKHFCSGPEESKELIETRFRWPKDRHGHYPVPLLDQSNENGCSRRQLIHFGQIGKYHRFQQYDFGNKTNMKKYKNSIPPEIMVRDIKNVPIVIYVGKDDDLSTVEDSQWLQHEVSAVHKTHVLKDFDHDAMQRIDLKCKQLAPFLKKNQTTSGVKKIDHKENEKKHKNDTKHGRILESDETVVAPLKVSQCVFDQFEQLYTPLQTFNASSPEILNYGEAKGLYAPLHFIMGTVGFLAIVGLVIWMLMRAWNPLPAKRNSSKKYQDFVEDYDTAGSWRDNEEERDDINENELADFGGNKLKKKHSIM